jgi:RimJ/RimL family protein N-acetyltransferase
MDAEFISAIQTGERQIAERRLGAAIPEEWPDEGDRWLLGVRQKQMSADPSAAPWLVRAIVLRERKEMIGHIGFHGPPDAGGFVEVGYTVLPEHRRRGYAREAVQALFEWAQEAHDVHRFRASVGPWNEPSLALIAQLGFVQTGTQWDERDGEELVFELDRKKS